MHGLLALGFGLVIALLFFIAYELVMICGQLDRLNDQVDELNDNLCGYDDGGPGTPVEKIPYLRLVKEPKNSA